MVQFAETKPQPPANYPSALWQGWKGKDWRNYGFDIKAFFPTFLSNNPDSDPPNSRLGFDLFRVDYTQRANNFWQTALALNPAAIIVATRGNNAGWKFEEETINYRNIAANTDWKDVWGPLNAGGYGPALPHRPIIGGSAQDPSPHQNPAGPIPGSPPDSTLPAGSKRFSKLNNDNWQSVRDVNAVMGPGFAFNATDARRFVSELIGYHTNWYGDARDALPKPQRCPLRGSIHVSLQLTQPVAALAMEATLDSVCRKLNALGYPLAESLRQAVVGLQVQNCLLEPRTCVAISLRRHLDGRRYFCCSGPWLSGKGPVPFTVPDELPTGVRGGLK
jgi:hypothetical protein